MRRIIKFKIFVLIETSWNVKSDMTLRKAPELQVLIETSWNVKVEYINFLLSHHLRINRNIVECKGKFWKLIFLRQLRY